jgi:acyl-CoA thioester hydrolase
MSWKPEFGVVQPVEVHFDQLDAFRTLHHAEYIRLLDRALTAYWDTKGHHHDPALAPADSIPLIREVSVTFDRPIRDYGRVLVHLWIDRIGTTSYVVGFRIVSADGAEQYAHGTRAEIKVDPVTMRPSPIAGRAMRDLRELLRPEPPEA